jgi:hypothetical protein
MITFSFFITLYGILSRLTVNRKHIILNYNLQPAVHNSLRRGTHNSVTWKHFMNSIAVSMLN